MRFAAKQKPHRPGIAPALGLRAGGVVWTQYSADRLHKGDPHHVGPTPLSPVDVRDGLRPVCRGRAAGPSAAAPHAKPPRTLAELAELLRRSEPPLCAVPAADHDPEVGLYLCERPQPREQLQLLRRLPEQGDRWRGIVFCEWNRRLGEVADEGEENRENREENRDIQDCLRARSEGKTGKTGKTGTFRIVCEQDSEDDPSRILK